jgi:hypothetical protein
MFGMNCVKGVPDPNNRKPGINYTKTTFKHEKIFTENSYGGIMAGKPFGIARLYRACRD